MSDELSVVALACGAFSTVCTGVGIKVGGVLFTCSSASADVMFPKWIAKRLLRLTKNNKQQASKKFS